MCQCSVGGGTIAVLYSSEIYLDSSMNQNMPLVVPMRSLEEFWIRTCPWAVHSTIGISIGVNCDGCGSRCGAHASLQVILWEIFVYIKINACKFCSFIIQGLCITVKSVYKESFYKE